MLTGKAGLLAFYSLWHYFCAPNAPHLVYLTFTDNIYPIKELLTVELRAQGSEYTIQCPELCALRFKNAY
jgi:hypothetical protein